jgi:hypothetical protein
MARSDDRQSIDRLTFRFLEEGLRSLLRLHETIRFVAEDQDTRRLWVAELRNFAARSQRLYEKWITEYPELGTGEEQELSTHENVPTPRM